MVIYQCFQGLFYIRTEAQLFHFCLKKKNPKNIQIEIVIIWSVRNSKIQVGWGGGGEFLGLQLPSKPE